MAVNAKPDAAGAPPAPAVICTTTMLHNIHTEKPMCSAKIEKIRLRRAIGRPTLAQNCGSSGRQSSIQCLPRRAGATSAGGGAPVRVSDSVTVMARISCRDGPG